MFTINDDVAEFILSLVDQKDALALASTCRSLHGPSMRRALSQLTIRDTYRGNDRVQSFCDYLLADPDHRPLYLTSLRIYGVWTKDNMVSAFNSLAAVLRRAHCLRELYLAQRVKFAIDACPAFADALASLHSLHAVDIADVDWDVISPILSRMPCQLRVLRVDMDNFRWRRKGSKLRHLHHFVDSLTTLALYNESTNILDILAPHTVWPHVHTLSLVQTQLHTARHLSRAFPDARAFRAESIYDTDINTPPVWPRLDFANLGSRMPIGRVCHLQLSIDCENHHSRLFYC